MFNWIKSHLRGVGAGSVLSVAALAPMMPTQCAPQTCAEKPSSQECTPPYAVGTGDGTTVMGGTAIAGRQYLQEAQQTLLRVVLVCAGDNFYTLGPWANADNTSGNLVQTSWSCYPRRAAVVTYQTQHS